jgi:hypothetical protein
MSLYFLGLKTNNITTKTTFSRAMATPKLLIHKGKSIKKKEIIEAEKQTILIIIETEKRTSLISFIIPTLDRSK